MRNKIFSLIFIGCFVAMAGLASFFGPYVPEHMTMGKFISVSFFGFYEIMCVVAFAYFWMKGAD